MTLRISVLVFWDNASISFSFHKNPPQNMLSFSNSLFIRAGRALEPDTSECDLGDTENLSKLQSVLWSLSHSVLIREMKVPGSLPELFRGWQKTPHVSERVCALPRTWRTGTQQLAMSSFKSRPATNLLPVLSPFYESHAVHFVLRLLMRLPWTLLSR